MNAIINITSQGQVGIPVNIRHLLGFSAPGKAVLSVQNSKLVIEPVVDLLTLGGAIAQKAKYPDSDTAIAEENKYIKLRYKNPSESLKFTKVNES